MGKGQRNRRTREFHDTRITNRGMQYRSDENVQGIADPGEGFHLWVVTAAWRIIDPEKAIKGGMHLDMENLLDVSMPACFKCEQPYDGELASTRCRGSIDPL